MKIFHRDRTRRIMRLSTKLQQANIVKETKKKPSPVGGKLPVHFVIAVYDKATRKMIDYKQLIKHFNKQTRKWWQKLSANEFEKLLKGVGKHADGTQRVKESDTINVF